ncbi:Uma2 family endonuclease [Streptomyces katsurahamanus]|uniref:Uma2 family endonuclease n=1 Tax=Streptomyces katsurahamanus TaxID=2577098 RepID=A0ABW9P0G9_9ACTN|nr:Uma2 family endonuclease [Streptomyces katsurahamanus]MQS39077.1 Uma2 family endonuclease [Streptomyces katsurahamanus]
MSAAAVERPCDSEPESLLEMADRLSEQNPGYRVEIIGGILTVSPSADGDHADVLTDLMVPFIDAGLHGKETRIHQNISIWLPGGPSDYAIPDLAVVDADYRDHVVEHGCYDPKIFHLVVEVTSSNYNNDLHVKVNAYAEAQVPVYLIVNRKHGRVHVLTDPEGAVYEKHQVFAPGQQVTLPTSIGAEGTPPITLDASELLKV